MLGQISTANSSKHIEENISYKHIAHLWQQCHNSVTTVSLQCHYSVTTVSLQCHYSVTAVSQQCHYSKCVIFQERLLKVLKCYNFLWVQRRHNWCPAASFANCVMTLYLLKMHLQKFLFIQITQKCQILSCDTLVANERNVRKWVIF